MKKLVYAGLILCFSFLLIAAGCQVTQQPPKPSLSEIETLTYAGGFTGLIMQVDSSIVETIKASKIKGQKAPSLSATRIKSKAVRGYQTEVFDPTTQYWHVTDEADNFLGHYTANYYYKKITDESNNIVEFRLYGNISVKSPVGESSTTTMNPGGGYYMWKLMMGKNISDPPQAPSQVPVENQIRAFLTYYTDANGQYPAPCDRKAGDLRDKIIVGDISLKVYKPGNYPSGKPYIDTSTYLNLTQEEYGAPQNGQLLYSLKVDGVEFLPIDVKLEDGTFFTKILGISLPLNVPIDILFKGSTPCFNISGTVSADNNWGSNGGTLHLYNVRKQDLENVLGSPTQPPTPNPDGSFTYTYENIDQSKADALNSLMNQNPNPVPGWFTINPGETSKKYSFYPPQGMDFNEYYIFARVFQDEPGKAGSHSDPLPQPGDKYACGEYADGNGLIVPQGQMISISPTIITYNKTWEGIDIQTKGFVEVGGSSGPTIDGMIMEDPGNLWAARDTNNTGAVKIFVIALSNFNLDSFNKPTGLIGFQEIDVNLSAPHIVPFSVQLGSMPDPQIVYMIAILMPSDRNGPPMLGDLAGEFNDGLWPTQWTSPPTPPNPVLGIGDPVNLFSSGPPFNIPLKGSVQQISF